MLRMEVTTKYAGTVTLELEHSLLSLSKWEEKFGKPFLGKGQKTTAEMQAYYRLMLTSPEQDPDLVIALSPDQQDQIIKYINSVPGATEWPPKVKGSGSGEVQTAELIYSLMTLLRIPWEAQTWHVHRLLLLIAWVSYKQTPEKERQKKSMKEKLSDWTAVNEANRKFFNSKG